MFSVKIESKSITTFDPLDLDHIEVYGIRYTLYDLLSAPDNIQVM